EKEPLTNEEYNTLKAIYKKSESVQNGLRNVQSDIIDKNLSWIDVQTVSAQKEAPRDNVIINGFKHVEQTKSTVDQDFGPTFT
ncbi:germination protein YpeB, partial [Pseudomonas sp. FW305-BF6]|uniref:PepSY1/2 domain-containing protein n=1 Tax=Pseudomonas sp. FW305-BF6 TaxID=2070673 RepID=UPI000CBEB3FD